jgi:hypothetical protein
VDSFWDELVGAADVIDVIRIAAEPRQPAP